METLHIVFRVLLSALSLLGLGFTPMHGGDFPPSEPVESGDPSAFIQIDSLDEGIDTWNPTEAGGYRYGPSMILNADGSLDVWSASNGPGDLVDIECVEDVFVVDPL